jgi:hypothetical protein
VSIQRLFLLSAVLVFSAALLHASGAELAATNVVLGLLLPPEEAQAASLREGAQLAVEQANKTPGKHVALMVRGRVGLGGWCSMTARRL